MILQIYFEKPNLITIQVPRNKLQVLFWGQPFLKSAKGNYVELGYISTKEVPAQIKPHIGKIIAKVADSGGNIGKYALISAAVLYIFIALPLQKLISYVKKFQVIVHMMCVNLAIPASA